MIDEPVLRLGSVDLGQIVEIASLAEVFDFAKDYLGLLKAAIIAAGIVPPGVEGSGERLEDRGVPPALAQSLESQLVTADVRLHRAFPDDSILLNDLVA